MKRYIFGKRNLIHIIDIRETVRGLLLAKKFVEKTVAEGKDVLFIGTKRQARHAVETHAMECNMHWVTERWLGGTLTNFREIRKRITRLEELEQLEADGMLDTYSKKQGATLRREMRKIRRNLEGLRRMTKLPGAMVAVDQKREIIAVREANKIGIPVVCLLDTDCDPDMVNIPIPGNDDAMKAIDLILTELSNAIAAGLKGREASDEEPQEGPPQRRRSRRATTARADEPPAPGATDEAAPAAPADQPAPAGTPEA